MHTADYIKMAAFLELKEALEVKRVNDEPEREKIIELMDKAMAIEDKLPPTRNQQHFKHGDDSTEPLFFYYLLIIHSNNFYLRVHNCSIRKKLLCWTIPKFVFQISF